MTWLAGGMRWLTAVAMSACVLVAAAHAAPKQLNGFIGGEPAGTGGSFVEPTAVTVYAGEAEDPHDDKIFVVEGLGSNSRVQRLDANGNFELAWGKDVVRAGMRDDRGGGYEVCRWAASCKTAPAGAADGEMARPTGAAVDPRSGDVYVADSGNRRVQHFDAHGTFVRAWNLDIGASGATDVPAAIAISPRPPHDVFVGDGATNRVLQFDRFGRFIRAWGWGVDDGTTTFQVCTAGSSCQRGHRLKGRATATPRWPNHIAVDSNGVVYASVFLGSIFDDQRARTRIERFRSAPAPDPPDASAALLEPLRPEDPYRLPRRRDLAPVLTNGATEGLAMDPTTSSLLAINNPFGTSELDMISNPGARRGERPRPSLSVLDTLPFLQNVTGMAIADDIVLLSSGTVTPETGTSSYTGCADVDARTDCHGLIALAQGRSALLALTGPLRTGISAWIDTNGVARYELQVSPDGRNWRRAEPVRYVMGSTYEPVELEARGLTPGRLYRTRLLVRKRHQTGVETVVSNLGLTVGGNDAADWREDS